MNKKKFWNNNYTKYESNGDEKKKLITREISLKKIKPYLRNIITDLQNSNTWKIQLIISINFTSSKDAEEERAMHAMSDKIKLTP